jgi:hypothetical protein
VRRTAGLARSYAGGATACPYAGDHAPRALRDRSTARRRRRNGWDRWIGMSSLATLRSSESHAAMSSRRSRPESVELLHRRVRALDIGSSRPAIERTDAFTMEPPGFQLHRWNGRTLFTYILNVGSYEGHFPSTESPRDHRRDHGTIERHYVGALKLRHWASSGSESRRINCSSTHDQRGGNSRF